MLVFKEYVFYEVKLIGGYLFVNYYHIAWQAVLSVLTSPHTTDGRGTDNGTMMERIPLFTDLSIFILHI